MTSRGRRSERVVMQQIRFLALLVVGAAVLIDQAQAMSSRGAGAKQGRKLWAVTQRASMPYRLPKVYEVGGAGIAWAVPSSPDFFENWAATVTFRPGDGLQFNEPAQGYVDSVPASSYLNCSSEGYYEYWSTSRMNEFFLQLEANHATSDGKLYFIHEGPTNNCTEGMKFAATVANVEVPSPPVPPPNTTKLQGRAAKEFQVGGTGKAWIVPSTIDFYTDWANNNTFRIGDTLKFNIYTTDFEVSKVPYTSFEMCVYTGYTWYTKDSSETFAFETTGVHYFVASRAQYCLKGMRFAAYVYTANGTLPNAPSSDDGGGMKWYYWVVIGFGIIGAVGLLYKCLTGRASGPAAEAKNGNGSPDIELVEKPNTNYLNELLDRPITEHPVFADQDGYALYGSD